MSKEQLPYYYVYEDDGFGYFEEVLHGPNDFECSLGEPEDRCFGRDLSNVVDELNKLHTKLEEAKDLIQELKYQVNELRFEGPCKL